MIPELLMVLNSCSESESPSVTTSSTATLLEHIGPVSTVVLAASGPRSTSEEIRR